MSEKTDVKIKAAIVQLKDKQVLGWIGDQLDLKTSSHEIMDELSAGLKELGDRFESGKCFIPELIRGGEIFLKAGMNMIRGAGTLEFANVVSKEKLLIDNEICGMARRVVQPMDRLPVMDNIPIV